MKWPLAEPPTASYASHRHALRPHPPAAWRHASTGPSTKNLSSVIAGRGGNERHGGRQSRDQVDFSNFVSMRTSRNQTAEEVRFKPLVLRDSYYRDKRVLEGTTSPGATRDELPRSGGDRDAIVKRKCRQADAPSIGESEFFAGVESESGTGLGYAIRAPLAGTTSYRRSRTHPRPARDSIPPTALADSMPRAVREGVASGGQRRNRVQKEQNERSRSGLRESTGRRPREPMVSGRFDNDSDIVYKGHHSRYSHNTGRKQKPSASRLTHRPPRYQQGFIVDLPSPSATSSAPYYRTLQESESICNIGSDGRCSSITSPEGNGMNGNGLSCDRRVRGSNEEHAYAGLRGYTNGTCEGLFVDRVSSEREFPITGKAGTDQFREFEAFAVEMDHRSSRAAEVPCGGALGDITFDNRKREGKDGRLEGLTEALTRVEARARQEVNVAEAGAADERRARAIAETSLSEALRRLEETRSMLQESLVNGPAVTLAALLEEKTEVEAMAKGAIEAAQAAATTARQEATAANRALETARGAEAEARDKDFTQAKEEREDPRNSLLEQQRVGENKERQFQATWTKARTEASACHAKVAALQSRLEQADVPGLQAMLVSLASEKTTAQARAAELEAKLTRAAEERRKRMKMSRDANEVATQRLSAAESRAATAEARVEAVARRLRAAEKAAAAAVAAAAVRGNGAGGELSPVDANARIKGGARLEGARIENAFSSASTGVEVAGHVFSANAVQEFAEATTTAQRLSEQKVAAEQRADELDREMGEARRELAIRTDVPRASTPSTFKVISSAERVADGGDTVSSLVREKQAAVQRAIEVEKELAEAHSRISLFEIVQDNANIASQTYEEDEGGVGSFNEAKQRVDEAEEQAEALRAELHRAKAQALTTAVEFAREKAQAARKAEELNRDLRTKEEELHRLQSTLGMARKQNGQVRERAETRLQELVANFREEVAGDTEVALATLSEEQHEVEVRAAKFAKAAEETRTELEEKLRQAIEAAGSAEERAEILRARLEKCRNADKMIAAAETKSSQEKNGRDSAGREITAVLGTTEHTAVDMLSERTTNQTNCRVHVGYEGGAGCNAESTGRVFATTSASAGIADNEQMTSTEAQLCVTEIALQNATTEIEKLQRDLDQAQEANMTAIGRTQAAEGKVVELEFGLHEVEREHALFKGRAESRLEILRLSFEQEEREGAAQAALAALIEEKAQVEARTVELEQGLIEATEVARATDLEIVRLKADIQHQAKMEHTNKQVEAASAAREEKIVAASERAAAAEGVLRAAKSASESSRAECEHLTRELERARISENETVEGRRLAEARIAELENAIEAASIEQERTRGRAESRLDALKRNLEQEELESGSQDALGCLLQDKEQAEERTAELEQKLLQTERLKAEAESKYNDAIAAPSEDTLRYKVTSLPDKLDRARGAQEAIYGDTTSAEASRTREEEMTIAVRNAEGAVKEAREEVELLRGELERVQAVESASSQRRRIGEERIAELEGVLDATEREHELFRERADARLDQLRLTFDQEERESGVQAALNALMDEKAEVERRNHAIVQAADRERVDLELRLQQTADALRAAEAKADTLQAEIDSAKLEEDRERSETVAAGGASSNKLHAFSSAFGTAGIGSMEDTERSAACQQGATQAAACGRMIKADAMLRDAKNVAENARAEVESVRKELQQAREANTAAVAKAAADKKMAEERISELETAIEKAEGNREMMRTRLESRLEALGSAFEQEQQERGAQNALVALLEEKNTLEKRAVEAERRLLYASEAVNVAEAEARILEADRKQATSKASDAAEPEKEDGMEDNRTASEIAERLVTEARNSTQEAKDGLRESKAEVEALRAELALAQAAEENAMSAAVDERRAAKERAVELQGIIDQAEINHALFREIMQSRLQSLKLAQDHENSCQQEALAALLKEKFQAEVTAANLAQTSTDTQTSLENKLTIADEALRAAESRSETLKTELNRVKADAAECVKRAERATAEGIEAAASATFAEARATAALADAAARAAAEKVTEAAAGERAAAVEAAVLDAEVTSKRIKEERAAVRQELETTRAAETMAREERDAAREKVSTLQNALKETEREHALSRQRAESRLESLRLAAEQEEVESGAEVALKCLLEEKNTSQLRVADLERQLLDARTAVNTAEAEINALKIDLDRTEREAVERANMLTERETSAAKRVQVAEEKLLKAEIDLQKTKEEMNSIQDELQSASELATAAAAYAAEHIAKAQERIAQLESENALFRERVESRLDGLRTSVEKEEQEGDATMALAALLEENARAELRANELQRRLEQTSGAVRGAEERAEALKNELEESRHGAIGIRALASSAAATAHSRDAKKPSKALADTAAEARAAAAEAALSKALEAVEELESRCAQAQAREREVERKSAAQMEVLKREWEEATSNGPKAALRALLEKTEAMAASGDDAHQALVTAEERVAELEDKLKTAEETSAAVLGGQVNKLGLEVVAQDTEASHVEDDPFGDWGMANVGVSDAKEESDGGVSQQSSDGDGYNVTIVQLLAERDNLLRESEVLEKKVEGAIILREEEAYLRTIGVGRYELTLDIMEEDLENTREKLAEAQAALLQSGAHEELEERFRALCLRAKHAEDGRRRADDQLAETRQQLLNASWTFEEELRRHAKHPGNLDVNVNVSSATQTSPYEHQTSPARSDETQTAIENRVEMVSVDKHDRAVKTSTNQCSSLAVVGHPSNHSEALVVEDCEGGGDSGDIIGRRASIWEDERGFESSEYLEDVADGREAMQNARMRDCDTSAVTMAKSIEESEELRDDACGGGGRKCLNVEQTPTNLSVEVLLKCCLTEVDANTSKETPVRRVRPTNTATPPDHQREENEAVLVAFDRSSQAMNSHPFDNQDMSGIPRAERGNEVAGVRVDADYNKSVHQREACGVQAIQGGENAETEGQNESQSADKASTAFGARNLDVEQVPFTPTNADSAGAYMESKRFVQTIFGEEEDPSNVPGVSDTSDVYPVLSEEIGCIVKHAPSQEDYAAAGIASGEPVPVVEKGNDGSECMLPVSRDYDVPGRESELKNTPSLGGAFCEGGKADERNFIEVNTRTIELPTAPEEGVDAIGGVTSVQMNNVPVITVETSTPAKKRPAVDTLDSATAATEDTRAIPDLRPDVSQSENEQGDDSSPDRRKQGPESAHQGRFHERVRSFGSSRRARETGILSTKVEEAAVARQSPANGVRKGKGVLRSKPSMLRPFRASKPVEGKATKFDTKKSETSANSKLNASDVCKAAVKTASAIGGKIPRLQAPEAAESVRERPKTEIIKIDNKGDINEGSSGGNGKTLSGRSGPTVRSLLRPNNDHGDRNLRRPSRSNSSSARDSERPRDDLHTDATSRPENPSDKYNGFAGPSSIGKEALCQDPPRGFTTFLSFRRKKNGRSTTRSESPKARGRGSDSEIVEYQAVRDRGRDVVRRGGSARGGGGIRSESPGARV